MNNITISPANPSDARFIAETVLEAMELAHYGDIPEEYAGLDEVCLREDTLYSYRHALIARVDGVPAACLVSYPGDIYREFRERTFCLISEQRGEALQPGGEMETYPGEYYLDSAAVVPEFRGMKLAGKLINAAVAKARREGWRLVTLIADANRDWLRKYYASLGFVEAEHMMFFGEEFVRMKQPLSRKLAVFDLDGTLVNSIGDLSDAVNHALDIQGFPTHSGQECLKMVGHGVRNLCRKALPQAMQDDEALVDRTLGLFRAYYEAHLLDRTLPYPGTVQMLTDLSSAGVSLAVASNKFQEGTEVIVKKLFPLVDFAAVLGNREGWPLKPSPEIVWKAMEAAGMDRSDAAGNVVMAGDSQTDMLTARNAGVPGIAASWGFRPAESLTDAGVICTDAYDMCSEILGALGIICK